MERIGKASCAILRSLYCPQSNKESRGSFQASDCHDQIHIRDYSGRGIKNLLLKHDGRDQQVVLIHGLEGAFISSNGL